MRILSQDNTTDIPYEQFAFIMFFNELLSGKYEIDARITGNASYKMAEYSTEAKARKAMEMLREECTFEKQFETICNGTTDYPSRPMYYFQFPQDSEVEA